MKVYLAGMFFTIKDRKAQATELRALGIGVTSRWVEETVPHTVEVKDVPDKYLEETAVADIDDIEACDVFVEFVPSDTELVDVTVRASSRGGRHFEMGYAYCAGKTIFVVGPKENVFHHLPEGFRNKPRIRHFATWEDVKFALMAKLAYEQDVATF
jgi:nucleoside 2-deoxyribosyltransferase